MVENEAKEKSGKDCLKSEGKKVVDGSTYRKRGHSKRR